MATLTAANAVYLLGILNLFPVPQQLQGYSTDDAFDSDAVEPAEAMVGVDGIMSAGWLPTLRRQTIVLQADSPSNLIFDGWDAAQRAARELYLANGLIRIPSIGMSYVLTSGVLASYRPVPPVHRVLQPRQYMITWGDISGAPI